MTARFKTVLLIMAAGVTLAACNKSTKDAQADAVRDTSNAAASSMDQKADAVESQGDAAADTTEANADATAEAMRNQADAMENKGEAKADAIEAGKIGVTTSTGDTTTTTMPTK